MNGGLPLLRGFVAFGFLLPQFFFYLVGTEAMRFNSVNTDSLLRMIKRKLNSP